MSEQRRAFLEYKNRTAKHGKPFFPHGVWHDVIAACVVMLVIIGISTVWFAQANCDSWFNVSCDHVATPLEQEHFTPDEPGTIVKNDKGEVDHGARAPLFGPLYEVKADPATTSYHPRPEWYFYFMFYLLVIFSNPNLVLLGTIGIPTIWLIMLIALPFVDRQKERRPSRRPVAMSLMVLTVIMLMSFSYLGSQAGKHNTEGPEGLTDEQMAMPGYAVLFEEGAYETCQSCHQLGGIGNGGPGPNLDATGTRYDSADELTEVMGKGLGGGAMPVKGGANITDEQAAQVAAFLKTLGDPGSVAELNAYGIDDWNRVMGGEEDSGEAPADQDGEDAAPIDGDEGAAGAKPAAGSTPTDE